MKQQQTFYKLPIFKQSEIHAHNSPIYSCKFNVDGEYVLTGSQERSIKLWSVKSKIMIKEYGGGHNQEVLDLLIYKDNSRFLSVGGDKSFFLWDILTGKIIRKEDAHNSAINTLDINNDYTVLITGSYDASIKFWDLKSNSHRPIQVCKQFKDSVSKVIIDNHIIYVSSIDGYLRQFDLRKGEICQDQIGQSIVNMDQAHDKKVLCLSCLDNSVKLCEIASGDILNQYNDHKNSIHKTEAKFMWDDNHIISGSEDGKIYIYNILKNSFTKKIQLIDNKTVSSLQLSSDKQKMVAATHLGSFFIYDNQQLST